MKKLKPIILKVIKITAGKSHCWVETDKGIFRKEIKNVPTGMFKDNV